MKIASLVTVLIFWVSLSAVIYTYLVYPLILLFFFAISQLRTDFRYLFNRVDRRVGRLKTILPSVTLVIPAHNEETHLSEKLRNIEAFDYPRDKLQVVVVSDGSSDGTNDILRDIQDPRIETLILPKRSGKSAALNRGVEVARHDILVFSDASTLFEPDTVRHLVRHFRDPQTGAVCGALRFQASPDSRQTEGVYWKYESALRLMEGRLGATLNASGAVYALRREAYSPLPIGAVLDDLLVPMNARTLGYRVLYDPEAVATDFAPDTIRGEFARRVRIAAGSFQALPIVMRSSLDGFAGFSFISHKLLRWIVPLFLVALLASNAILVTRPLYTAFALLQFAFYLWAFLGFACHKYFRGVRFALIGYFLLAMNAAFVVGFFRYIQNRQAIEWQRVA